MGAAVQRVSPHRPTGAGTLTPRAAGLTSASPACEIAPP